MDEVSKNSRSTKDRIESLNQICGEKRNRVQQEYWNFAEIYTTYEERTIP